MAKSTLERGRNLINSDHIIGIGASAGGMEAIHDLFDAMPPDTGISFVVIQHLSPDHKSLLVELLAKHTSMHVLEASNGVLVEPNCIYVIPSKKLMTIQNRRLYLAEKARTSQPNHAIDVFFEALSKDQGKKAIGIILSGTGTDGTKGLQAIRNMGGTAIVQDPLTATFDGMPTSAVESGSADIVLPPEMIGEELVELLKGKLPINLREEDEATLLDILDLLHKGTRYDFSQYKRPTLLRRLSKRMSELNIRNLKEYRNYAKEHVDELKTLSQEFLINVTKFFRDPEAFKRLQSDIIPAIFSNKGPEDKIKVWIVACSTGEEAYTVAILFLEYMRKLEDSFPNVKFFATDIDAGALEIASRGIFGLGIAEDVPQPLLSRYFIREGDAFRVTSELRKLVVFANHNAIKDPPFSRLDLILCRNMFIYMNTKLQAKALRKFHFALNVNSYLMLGPSENVGILKEVMQEVNRKWKIYRCITKTLGDADEMFVPLENTVYPKGLIPARKNSAVNLSEILKDTLLEDRKIALILIDKEFNVKQATGSYKSFVQLPEENFNINILKLVSADLSVALGITVRKALAENVSSKMKHVVLRDREDSRLVNIIVRPYLHRDDSNQALVSILIEELPSEIKTTRSIPGSSMENREQVLALEKELTETRQNLQAIIEEMETVNEELQSSNEEMISTNEELQSTNEELQSLNEELHTVSAEHQLKIKELFELNDDLNNYFNNSDIGQILVDSHQAIRKFSPASKKIINLIDSDIGRSLPDITTNLRNIDFIEHVSRVLTQHKPFETEVQTTEGKFYLMRINPYLRRDKTTDGAVINFIDISQSKRLSSIIEGVFESSTNGITAKKAIRDKQHKIIDFEYLALNTAAEQMFRVQHQWLVGKRLLEVFGKATNEYFNIYVNVVETGNPTSLEFFHESTGKWYETTIVKMLDGIVTTHIDITDRKNSADLIAKNYEDLKLATEKLSESNVQLERSNFDLMQFASVASHDLKEPLRKIQAFGNILQSKIKQKLSEGELSYFSKIISASNRMQALIDDVLTLSKLSNNNSMHVRTDLNRIVRQIIDDMEITIRERNAVIQTDVLPFIDAVPGQMHQVFQNLISNALKFTNKKLPVVTIQQNPIPQQHVEDLAVTSDRYVYITVTDNGIGFEDEYKEKIFGVFQRLHGRNYEGTGIGLAIARKIVENHEGFIFANGEVNKGSTFHIYLPSKMNRPASANDHIAKVADGTGNNEGDTQAHQHASTITISNAGR